MRQAYQQARCELVFSSPLELAVAAILSAQCTDKRVNIVTPALFKKYRTASDWAAVSQETLETEIHSVGFFRNKAKNIRALAQTLVSLFKGVLPDDLDVLASLPGIGRKTANVILIAAFNKPGITVDTHCRRVSQRLGFTASNDPAKIESELKALAPERDWIALSHCLVFHGRYCCLARRPHCAQCPVAHLCPSKELFS